jgi:hypothetical protein
MSLFQTFPVRLRHQKYLKCAVPPKFFDFRIWQEGNIYLKIRYVIPLKNEKIHPDYSKWIVYKRPFINNF